MNITSAAKSLNEAQIVFDKAWHKYFDEIEPLSRKRFWELMPCFISNLDKDFNSEKACREFVRKSEYSDESYTFDEAVRFARAWDAYKSDLRNSEFSNIKFGKGDDSCGDLIDSLPLAGPEFMGRCLVGDFSGLTEFCVELAAASKFSKQIYNGENYFGMFLEDSVKEFFLYQEQNV